MSSVNRTVLEVSFGVERSLGVLSSTRTSIFANLPSTELKLRMLYCLEFVVVRYLAIP